ncbi:restriction endonuclease [Parvibaculum sp.]|uniref:restriction endonuclease n=1 Tax=Parvibaculum sp. TaxID=2024848 RepID=UPI002BDEBEA9|nr:restriction endonuclease [Parvibaculum sp.]HUD52405.1 restriction endonuclease [Parvibaculum sp.]
MAATKDIPTVQALIPATVVILKQLGGSGSNEEIHDAAAAFFNLSEEQIDLSRKEGSTDTLFAYRLRWARSYLKKVGAADNTERGIWTLTPKGRDMNANELKEVHRVVQSMRTKRAETPTIETEAVEPEAVETEAEELDWSERLLSVLLTLKPDAFERLCQRVLRESGFTKVEVTGKSGDGGIDGNGVLRMKLVSFQVLFQCKRWKDTVGSSVVRDFRGAMVGRADKGLIMTTGRFTAEARKEATRDGAPAIDLVDGDDLCQLLRELKIGVRTKIVEEIEIDEDVLAAI